MAVQLQDIPQQARWNEIRAALQANLNALNQAIESGTNAEGKPLATVEYVDEQDDTIRSDLAEGRLKPLASHMANKDGQGRVINETYVTKSDMQWK